MHHRQEWFKTWFDSHYYHTLYNNRDTSEAEKFISKLLAHLDLKKDSEVLDLGCGKGRHANQLHLNNLKVTGLDLSIESISAAMLEFGKPGLSFIQSDMRNSFGTASFDAVFNLFTSFGYFDDSKEDKKVLANVTESLKPQGIFIQDYLNPTWARETLVAEETKVKDKISFHITKEIIDNFIIKTISFTDKGENYSFHEKVKLITIEEFKELYASLGLEIIKVFGSYDLDAFKEETSPRLILHSKKK